MGKPGPTRPRTIWKLPKPSWKSASRYSEVVDPLPPLILTALLDPASQARFDRERQAYFPAAINFIPAHVTLFHHLPGAEHPAIDAGLAELCQDEAPSPFLTTGLRFLGRGTAYTLQLPAVAMLRKRLAEMWQPWLTAQDRQPWKPHITVQNKVAPDVAKRMHQALLADFTPHQGTVIGVSVWRYLDGPWEFLGHQLFRRTFA